MACILIATFPGEGHTNPALPVARTLIARGHEVVWYTGRRYRAAVEATGARFAPRVEAWEPENGRPPGHAPSEPERGMKALTSAMRRVFISDIAGQLADLKGIVKAFPADVVLADPLMLGVGALHELGGPPWATLGLLPLLLSSADTAPFGLGLQPGASPLAVLRNRLLNGLAGPMFYREMDEDLRRARASVGLPPGRASMFEATVSPYLYLQGATPAFEYPRGDLPPHVHFIGPLLPPAPRDFTPPAWWSELRRTRPVILVNQGTISNNPNDLIVPALRALAGDDALVIVTTGGASADEIERAYASAVEVSELAAETRAALHIGQLGGFVHSYHVPPPHQRTERPRALPANARVEPFLPFGAVLPHVDVMVTNGGYGGVQLALAHGVPLVVAGNTEEKGEIAARVAWSGAGINLKTSTPAPAQIRSAVRAALAEPRYREDAQRIAADYARHNAPDEVAALLERLMLTQQPVLREEAQGEREARPIQLGVDGKAV